GGIAEIYHLPEDGPFPFIVMDLLAGPVLPEDIIKHGMVLLCGNIRGIPYQPLLLLEQQHLFEVWIEFPDIIDGIMAELSPLPSSTVRVEPELKDVSMIRGWHITEFCLGSCVPVIDHPVGVESRSSLYLMEVLAEVRVDDCKVQPD